MTDPRYDQNGQPPPSLFRLLAWMAVPPYAVYRLARAGYLDDVMGVLWRSGMDAAEAYAVMGRRIVEDVLDGIDNNEEGEEG